MVAVERAPFDTSKKKMGFVTRGGKVRRCTANIVVRKRLCAETTVVEMAGL